MLLSHITNSLPTLNVIFYFYHLIMHQLLCDAHTVLEHHFLGLGQRSASDIFPDQ